MEKAVKIKQKNPGMHQKGKKEKKRLKNRLSDTSLEMKLCDIRTLVNGYGMRGTSSHHEFSCKECQGNIPSSLCIKFYVSSGGAS